MEAESTTGTQGKFSQMEILKKKKFLNGQRGHGSVA